MVEEVSSVEESTPQIAQLLGTQLHQFSRIVKQIAARTRVNEAGVQLCRCVDYRA